MVMLPPSPDAISKVLSYNDTGESGAHQAGILVPKSPEILSFFPRLGTSEKNPRVHMEFVDDEGGGWIFAFIYYNNIFYGGTRNEYRLTRMTKYIQSNGLRAGDELILAREDDEHRCISFKRAGPRPVLINGILHLGTEWRVIPISTRRLS